MKVKKIVVGISIDNGSGREVLSGFFNYTEANSLWRMRLVQSPSELTAETVRSAEASGVDGYVISFQCPDETIRALSATAKPIVVVGIRNSGLENRRAPTAFVFNDNESIGTVAGDFAATLGNFRSYAYVHARRERGYSDGRLIGFRSAIERHGHGSVNVYAANSSEGSDEDIAALSNWLAGLPKPIALMAGCDWRAMHVLDAAQKSGLDVPGQVAVIGVDNDALLDAHSSPPLTSVHPDHAKIGFLAAKELQRMMNPRNRTVNRMTDVPPKGIVERESTRNIAPLSKLVNRAQQFISENACRGIETADVISHLGCSRNLADLRYKAAEGMTIRAAIEKARLDEVSRLLRTTRRSLKTIAAQCGFSSSCRLSHLFHERFGISPREWRKEEYDKRKVR